MHVRARRAHSTAQAHRRPAAAAIPRGPPALGMISAAGEAGKGAGAYVLSAPIDIMHAADSRRGAGRSAGRSMMARFIGSIRARRQYCAAASAGIPARRTPSRLPAAAALESESSSPGLVAQHATRGMLSRLGLGAQRP